VYSLMTFRVARYFCPFFTHRLIRPLYMAGSILPIECVYMFHILSDTQWTLSWRAATD